MATTPVNLDDLMLAYEWVSAGRPTENVAYVSLATGSIHWGSDTNDVEEELPEGVDDETLFVQVPHKFDLDLGRELALRFVAEVLPDALDEATWCFRQSRKRGGAYRHFKELLHRHGQLAAWGVYEDAAAERAMREWCERNGLRPTPGAGEAPTRSSTKS